MKKRYIWDRKLLKSLSIILYRETFGIHNYATVPVQLEQANLETKPLEVNKRKGKKNSEQAAQER